ncbi:MAG: hypothetical protein ACLQUZ_15625 [Rhizomicrobium sp.]
MRPQLKTYRFVFLDTLQRATGWQEEDYPDDIAAMARAQALSTAHNVSVWERTRPVGVAAIGGASVYRFKLYRKPAGPNGWRHAATAPLNSIDREFPDDAAAIAFARSEFALPGGEVEIHRGGRLVARLPTSPESE